MFFAISRPIVVTSDMGASSSGVFNTSTLAHRCCRGTSTPSPQYSHFEACAKRVPGTTMRGLPPSSPALLALQVLPHACDPVHWTLPTTNVQRSSLVQPWDNPSADPTLPGIHQTSCPTATDAASWI